jgi:hypothetical protein
MTATSTSARPGRNDPCPCGSGRKYKQCCLEKDEAAIRDALAKAAALSPEPAPDVPAPRARPPKHKTEQPWKKAATTRGFHSPVRTPRKVGGG